MPFIAMELVAGRPLSSIISTTMSPDMLARLGVQIAAALAHAHARGVVHGDLKPQNVMVRLRRRRPDEIPAVPSLGL